MFRVIIFAAANLGILLVMGVVFQLIGLDIWLVQSGTGFTTAGVLAFEACFGFGDALISLAFSKFMATRGMCVPTSWSILFSIQVCISKYVILLCFVV